MTDFGRRATQIEQRPMIQALQYAEPTAQQLALAEASFRVADTSLPGFRWRDQSRPFAVLSGHQSYGCYATEREALQRIVELKNP